MTHTTCQLSAGGLTLQVAREATEPTKWKTQIHMMDTHTHVLTVAHIVRDPIAPMGPLGILYMYTATQRYTQLLY